MVNTYEGILHDFAEKKIEAAFVGSLVAVLAMDQLGIQPLVKPELPDGVSSYHGVIFVRDDSDIYKIEQLKGRSLAMVRATTAGHVFPGCVIMRLGLYDGLDQPRIIWSGTHDDVFAKVMEGDAEIGAIKNLRLDALTRAHPQLKIRIITTGKSVPSNALVLRSDVAKESADEFSRILLAMADNTQGREALQAMGAVRFIPCSQQEYVSVYQMIECIRQVWDKIGVPSVIPSWPEDWPEHSEESFRCYAENY